MSQTSASPSQRSFPCRQCGAKLSFAPGTHALVCPYCNAENQIDGGEPQVAAEQDFKAVLATLEEDARTGNVTSLKCPACAAEVEVPLNVTSLTCPFCGNNIVAQPVSSSRIAPTAVLPFKVTGEQATGAFREWVRSRWFAPGMLKTRALIETPMAGLYMPAWTFDAKTDTEYVGQRGDAYFVTVGSGKNRRQERRIRWTGVRGRVHNDFDDVLVLASRSLPHEKAHALEPWDTPAAVPYADEYLAGFRAECYQIGLADGFVAAQGQMESWIETSIRHDIGGDEQRIDHKRVVYSGVTFKHLLLPLWIAAYRYHQKVYRVLVNARTGEVQGERPYSAPKIATAIIAGVLALAIVIYLISQR